MYHIVLILVSVQVVWILGADSSVDQLQRRLVSYQPCKEHTDCKIANSICDGSNQWNHGLCKCEEGFLIIRSRQSYDCVRPAESVESDCIYDEQCELSLGKDSECDIRNKCRCLDDAHYVKSSNSCFKTSRLNETCVTDENCVPNHPEDEVFCTNGRCTCGLKRAPNADGRCAVVRRLGEACNNDDSCLTMNAVCRGHCICRVGYVLADEGRYCLKAADYLFDSCTQNAQCEEFIQHSECVRGRCQCRSGYHQYGNNCYMAVGVGSYCRHKGECIVRNALEGRIDCVQNICLCGEGLEALECGDSSGSKSRLQVFGLLFGVFIFLII